MMSTELISRARRAYELSRVRAALLVAVLVVPMVLLSSSCCLDRSVLIGLACVLFVTLLGLVWRGQAHGAGAKAGLLAGGVAWAFPVFGRALGLTAAWGSPLVALCFVGGMVSGLIVARNQRLREDDRLRFLGTAAVIAGLTGSMGCIVAGLGGVVGMVGGALVGATPGLVRAALGRR